jgi:hypothetical protein
MWFRRQKTEPWEASAAAAALERAEAAAEEQQAKLRAEAPLRRRLAEIRAHNHLSDELYSVLSARRREEGQQP